MAGSIFCLNPDSLEHIDIVYLQISNDLRLTIFALNDECQDTFNSGLGDSYSLGAGYDSK
jgi:hypothetical protein